MTADAAAPGQTEPSSAVRASGSPAPDRVQSLARGLAVIRCFDADHPRRTLSDVAKATGLTRATARRFLLTLIDLGYVRVNGTEFALTPRVLELGYSYLSSLRLPDIAQPHLTALSETVGESTSLSILDGADIVYVAREQVSRIMTVSITIGTRLPARLTSMGRMLLAALGETELDAALGDADAPDTLLRRTLDAARSDGYCLVDQELEAGLRSIAAPVRGADGRVSAAVNISTSAGRYDTSVLTDTMLPELRATARAIEDDLARAGG